MAILSCTVAASAEDGGRVGVVAGRLTSSGEPVELQSEINLPVFTPGDTVRR